MTLTLRAVSLNDQPLTRPITAHFDAQGGSIGRSDQNTLALPDPERHISRQQAAIIAAGNAWSIRNIGSANPILVRGQSLLQGQSALLRHRDQVRIGGYLLEVVEEEDAQASTVTQGRARIDAHAAGQPRTGPPAEFDTPLSDSNPFADLMGDELPDGMSPDAEPSQQTDPGAYEPVEDADAEPIDAAGLWAAFREGAGLELDLPSSPTAGTMRAIGSLLRTAVGGTLRLVAARAEARHELHEPVTVIRARQNNPMKFSPDAQAALEQLLKPPVRGFLPGPQALQETMDDLVDHALATMAASRAATSGVLERFSPGRLEGILPGPGMLDSVLPMSRKARLWELYLLHYEALRREAQEDFRTLFGQAFAAAYEQQRSQAKLRD